MDHATEPSFLIVIGQISRPHGVHGELRVVPYTDLPERFSWLKTVYVGEKEPQLLQVESVRFHHDLILLKFVGYDDRDAAAVWRGALLQVPESEAIPLAEGEYFLFQLIGLDVVTDSGKPLGKLTQILETGANNVFCVNGEHGELLLPDIDEVILDIDFANGRMTVHPLPGLLPDELL